MSQSAAPWNADNFGTSTGGSIGGIKLYNPADFQNNTGPGQYSGSAFQPFPVDNSSTITEQPGKAGDAGQQQTPGTTAFQPYNPNSGQPTNQVPPDKESSGQFDPSQANATMNGSWGWDPSWGQPSNNWFGNNAPPPPSTQDAGFGNSFDTQNTQASAVHYFDQNQNQNYPQDGSSSSGQDWSAINSQQHPQQQQPQQQQQSQQQQPQQQQQQQLQYPQHSQQQYSQHQQQYPQQDYQQQQQQYPPPQQQQQQYQQQYQQHQQYQQYHQQQQQQLPQVQQQPQQLSQETPNSSQNTPLPPTNVPYSQSEYQTYNDYQSPMSLSTPSMGAPSSLSSPSTGQMPPPSDQHFGMVNPNPPSLNWPEVPADSDLSKSSDQHNEPSLPPSNPGQLANMGSQPNASNYFSSQGASFEPSLWQPTMPGEENSASGPVPLLSTSGPTPVSGPPQQPAVTDSSSDQQNTVESSLSQGPVPSSASGPIPTSGPPQQPAWTDPSDQLNAGDSSIQQGFLPMSVAGPLPMPPAAPIPTSGPPQQPAWAADSSHQQNAGDCNAQNFQTYHANQPTAESYFGQRTPFLEGNSSDNTNNPNSGGISVDAITQSFAQASISESAVAESIPSGASNISQSFTDVSLSNNPVPNPSAEVTGLMSQQNDSPQLPIGVPVDNAVKHGSIAGDWEIVSNPSSNQHSRQSSLGNAQFSDGSNQNLVASKPAPTISPPSQPLPPVNQAVLDSFNIATSEPNVQPPLPPISNPTSSVQPLSVAPPMPSLTIPLATETNFQPNSNQHQAKVFTDGNTQKQNTAKVPPVEATPNAAVMDSFATEANPGNNSVPTSLTGVGVPKSDGNPLHNEHTLNVYASEIQPRDSSPFQPPRPRQGSVEGVQPQSTSRSSSLESGHASQTSKTSGQARSVSSDGGRSSCGSQSSGTRPPLTLSRQSSHDSTRSLASSQGARSGMEQIKEQAADAKNQPTGNKGISWHDQTSAAIRAKAAAEARLQECMSPMTTLWDNPQISVSGIHLIPSVPVPSLVGVDPDANPTIQPVSIAPVKTPVEESKPKTENPKNQSRSSERSINSQPLTSTPNSSAAVTASSHDSSPIKPEQKSPTPSLNDTALSERDFNRKDPRERPSRDRDREHHEHDRDRNPRDRDLRDVDFRDRDCPDTRDAYNDYRESRDPRRDRYMREYDRDYHSRYRSMDPKDPRYDPYYDRPPSRLDYERFLEYQYYQNEPYDRPRSRQDDSDLKSERPLSRADYSRYKHKEMYPGPKPGGKDYDPDYYSRSAAYYNYYRDRYTRGGYYDDVDSWYYQDRARRHHRPCYLPPYSQYDEYYGAGTFDGYENASRTSREQSRAQTPAQEGIPSSIPPHYLSRDAAAAYEQGQEMYDYYYSHGYYGSEEYSAQDESNLEYYNQGRMTPAKFFTPHTCAVFGPGGRLIHVLPNRPGDGQPATVEIINVEDVLSDQNEAEEFHNFSGPLIRGETHKNDVLVFCQNKAKQYSENMDVVDKESAALLWRFLELLIKQNGTIVGTDIADLLLEGHQPSTADYLEAVSKFDDELDIPKPSSRPPSAQGSDTGTITTADRVLINKTTTATLNERTDRFRHLLLYGMKKDALRWAMKNNLWGHALFLASKMDNRTYADIMTRFANSAIQMNDPLQTLYQLMSGRQPASVTSLCDDNWGDWRPHLAMMLSNHSSRPELDKKSITTLGDTLAAKGCLHASHFCYLMAQVNFGTYSKKTSKIVLIGSSHSLSLNEFATNEAIQCTEIFEYAQLLGNSMYLMPSFQPYKLLYACRLADYGLTQEALHYCEVIASTVIQNPVYYQHTVVKVLTDISNRLKCYDPQRLQMGDMADPMWLQQLSNVCQSFEDGSIQPLSGSVTPLGPHVTANSSESGEVAAYLNHTQDSMLPRYPQQMPVGGPYVQNSQLMTNYTQDTSYQQYQQQQQQQTYYDNSGQQQQQQQQQVYGENMGKGRSVSRQSEGGDRTPSAEVQSGSQTPAKKKGEDYAYNTQQQQPQMEAIADPPYAYQSQGIPQTDPANYVSQDATGGVSQQGQPQLMPPPMSQSWQAQDSSQMSNQDQMLTSNPEDAEGMSEDQQSRRASESSIMTSTMGNAVDNQNSSNLGGFDYFEASTRKTIIPPTRYGSSRQRTLSESSNASTGSVKRAPTSKKSEGQKSKPASDPNQKSWWNIFSTFGGQRKKDMILPDDKNPSIVWDSDKQRWINTEEDDEPDVPSAPPPKDIELKSPPSVAGPPPPNGNMFSRTRARGARSKYVDVLNPTAAPQTVPENLFNVLPPPTTVAPVQNIFVPSGTNPPIETPTPTETTNGANENNSASPGYNHLTEPSTGELSRSSSMSSLSQEVHQLTRKQSEEDLSYQSSFVPYSEMSTQQKVFESILQFTNLPPQVETLPPVPKSVPSSSSSVSVQQSMPPPASAASGPMLYNPASFQNQSYAAVPSSGPTSRLAQRRVYPK